MIITHYLICKKLNLGEGFNQPIGTSLDKLVNLKELIIERSFDKPFGTSLDKLVNLEKLVFVNNRYYKHQLPNVKKIEHAHERETSEFVI
jgi:hypothetical protein